MGVPYQVSATGSDALKHHLTSLSRAASCHPLPRGPPRCLSLSAATGQLVFRQQADEDRYRRSLSRTRNATSATVRACA